MATKAQKEAAKQAKADRAAVIANGDNPGDPEVFGETAELSNPIVIGEKLQHLAGMLRKGKVEMTAVMKEEVHKQIEDIGQYLIDFGHDPEGTEPITL